MWKLITWSILCFWASIAGSLEVRTVSELRDALEDVTVAHITVASSVVLEAWPVLRVSRAVRLHGAPGVVLDFHAVDQPLIEVHSSGRLTFSSLLLANFSPGVPGSSAPIEQHVKTTGGAVVYDAVVFYSSGPALRLPLSLGGIKAHRQQQVVPSSSQPDHDSWAWRLDDWSTDAISVVGCSAVLDAQSCHAAGSAVVFDSASLLAALQHPQVTRITILQDMALQAAHCSGAGSPLVINRPVAMRSCPGAVLSLAALKACWLVSSGGLLHLQPGVRLSNTAASSDAAASSSAHSVLLIAVDVEGSGLVTMQDVQVQLSSAAEKRLQRLQDQPAAAAAAPKYRYAGHGSIVVDEWHLMVQQQQQYQQQQQQQQVNAVLGYTPALAPVQLHLGAASRRMLHSQPCSGHSKPSPRRQLLAATAGNSSKAPASAPVLANGSSLPAPVTAAAAGDASAATAAAGSSRDVTAAAQYVPGRCFSDFSFLAKDITDFVRLIKDPASTHIELTGDIVFTEELFPRANVNNKALGINVTQKVIIRACTGDSKRPIIVDINNLQQQIYVYGEMHWEGDIKIINSYPSPRRGGLFPLISIMSVEENGTIWLKDLQIHGSEACPLFDPNDKFWDRYGESPLSPQFVPQIDDFLRISPREVLVYHWKFNKTAWVLKSQGAHGVVKASGSGYWMFLNVLVTWSPINQGPQGAALIAAIVVPIVTGLLLIGGAVGFWRWHRRRAVKGASVAKLSKDIFTLQDQAKPDLLGGFSSTTGVQPNTACDSVLKLDSSRSQSSYSTQELIEEARRRMRGPGSARKDTSIVLEGLLGEGTFGKVYRGTWQGTVVAVKTMLFPAAMSGKEKREKMAIMETAISSSLSHPNIVQTYTYVVKPLTGELALQALERGKAGAPLPSPNPDDSDPTSLMGTDLGEHHGWEVRLVLELCDRGSLKELLNAGGFHKPDGKPDMVPIVATALDVARAMLHLHSENVIHSDLKARNVLLKSAGDDVRGFMAKVSDFGLSVRMDPAETHVSNVYQGTLTHMAPEVLMYGKISRASDVYAFGILLWELYTAQQAFKGTPRVLLGHEVAKMGHRPEFPPDCPFDYQLLACRCWESDPAIRPSFQQIWADLQRMAVKLSIVDPASSLPQPPQQAAAGSALQPQTHLQPAAAAANTALPAVGQGAVAQPPIVCPGGIDPTKLHYWEPQTSLLDLRTDNSMQGSSVPSSVPGASNPGDSRLMMMQQHSNDLSWGTQSAGGGWWLGGDLAPSNVPSDVQLPVQTTAEHAAVAAGMAGLHDGDQGYMQQHQVAIAAAGAAAQQQQQQQQQCGLTYGTAAARAAAPIGAVGTQRQGNAGESAAALGAVPAVGLQHYASANWPPGDVQQQHLQQQHLQQQHRPPLPPEQQLQQHEDPHQQELKRLEQLPYSHGKTDGLGTSSVSSSGVYLDDCSSTLGAGNSWLESADSGAACTLLQRGHAELPSHEPPAGRVLSYNSGMATIREVVEGQGTGQC